MSTKFSLGVHLVIDMYVASDTLTRYQILEQSDN